MCLPHQWGDWPRRQALCQITASQMPSPGHLTGILLRHLTGILLRIATQGSLFALRSEILHSWPLAPSSVCRRLPHYFKFYHWLLEYLKTEGFPSPSIHLFLVQGISFAIFISWPVTRPSVLHLEILLPCFGSSLEDWAHLLRHLWC